MSFLFDWIRRFSLVHSLLSIAYCRRAPGLLSIPVHVHNHMLKTIYRDFCSDSITCLCHPADACGWLGFRNEIFNAAHRNHGLIAYAV